MAPQDSTTPQEDRNRPSFELETYEDQTLAHNARLNELQNLVGHTVTHVFDRCQERGDTSELLLVTETGCWIVLEAKTDDWDKEYNTICVVADHELSSARRQLRRPELISDYISPEELFEAGLCGLGERDQLIAQKKALNDKAREEKAARLRAELTKLEGGAA